MIGLTGCFCCPPKAKPLRRILLVTILSLSVLLPSACEDRRSPTEQAVRWFPYSQQATARCIVHRESGGNPRAVSPSHDVGIFQINRVHASEFTRLTGKAFLPGAFDPRLNGQYALALWKSSGRSWRPWATHRVCGV